jgi:type IV pilus assembly protein PilC
MQSFKWEGLKNNIPDEGVIQARSIKEATTLLSKQQIVVVNIEPTEIIVQTGKKEKDYRPGRIKNKDIMVFTKKFGTMIKAGLPITKTMDMLESQSENPDLKKMISKIKKKIESGSTLSEAFAFHDKVFDSIYINLLKAGESSGKLTLFLEKLVIHIEKAEKIKKRIKSALMYPIILMSVAFAVIALMLVKVVPVFQGMFSSMGHALPGPTQLIVDISEFMRDPAKGGTLFVIIFSVIFAIKFAVKKNINIRRKFDRFVLKIPVFKDLISMSTLSKVAMVQSNLSAAGVSVLSALDIVSKSITNLTYVDAFDEIKRGVAEGRPLSKLYAEKEVFPPAFHQMVSVGEETGRVDEMLASVAMYYEEEFDNAVDRMTELLEPIMIVFMGITVGFIIVAMYMPIFQVGNVVSN